MMFQMMRISTASPSAAFTRSPISLRARLKVVVAGPYPPRRISIGRRGIGAPGVDAPRERIACLRLACGAKMRGMRDYWLSKLCFDLQDPARVAEYRRDRDAVLSRYPLKPEVRAAVLADDVGALARLTNPYLLRYYFAAAGMPDADFIARLRASAPADG